MHVSDIANYQWSCSGQLFEPLLFVLYINNWRDSINFYVCIKLFAAAVKLLTGSTLPPAVKTVALQEHLDMLARNRVQC